MSVKTILLGAAAGCAVLAGPAQAAQGDVLVRLRGIMVAPNEKSGSVLPAFPGEKVKVDESVMPEVDVTYMVTDHICRSVERREGKGWCSTVKYRWLRYH